MTTGIPSTEKKNFLIRRLKEVSVLEGFISTNNLKGYSQLCHQLKGSLGMWGFLNLSELASRTIFLWTEGNPLEDRGKKLLNQLLKRYSSALKNELKHVKNTQ